MESQEDIFSSLPFRVIIEILSYHQVDCTKELVSNHGPNQFFGIFKKDRTRKIFFLFPCINLTNGGEINVLMKVPQVQSLYIQTADVFFLKFVITESKNFYRLKNLEIDFRTDPRIRLECEGIFSKGNNFPNLKNLRMETTGKVDASKWVENHTFFSGNLVRLSLINQRRGNGFEGIGALFMSIEKWNRLEELDFIGLRLPSKSTIFAPKLRKISFNECRNVEIVNEGKTLEQVHLVGREDGYEMIRRLMERQTCLRFLTLCSNGMQTQNIDCMFKNKELHSFPKLEEIVFGQLEISESTTCLLPSHIRKVYLEGVSGFSDKQLSTSGFPCLESLILHNLDFNCADLIRPAFPFCKNLKVLELIYLDYHEDRMFNEDFFRVNDWDCLEILKIEDLPFCGRGWSRMPNMKHLHLTQNQREPASKMKFDDQFFIEQDFPKLTSMELESLHLVTGKGWEECSFLSTIDHMHLSACIGIGDSFFQNLHFSNMEKLLLFWLFEQQDEYDESVNVKVGELKGRGWKKMENLKYLQLEYCEHIADGLFGERGCGFDVLAVLIISHCEKIKGKNWLFLPSLKYLKVSLFRECDLKEYFGDDFWENKPFPDSKYLMKKEHCVGIVQ